MILIGIGLQQIQDACLKAHGLTRLQAGILLEVAYEPEPKITLEFRRAPTEPEWTATRLASVLKCSKVTVSKELALLDKRELTTREAKGIRKIITATDEGKALAQAYASRIGEESRRIFKGMGPVWNAALDRLENGIRGMTRRRVRRVPVA